MKKAIILMFIAVFSMASFANNNGLRKIEKTFDGKLGVYAIDTNNGKVISYRGDEMFPMLSTFKLIAVSALLKSSDEGKLSLSESIKYTKDDMVPWHPITVKYLDKGSMTLNELADAAMRYSDNTATNLISYKLGGLGTVNSFARSIGNRSFNMKNYESDLNSNPKIHDDSSTPREMALSTHKLLLGDVLSKKSRQILHNWMERNTTGNNKIRAGLPDGWSAAEKTGGGFYGAVNDIGIVWSNACKPIVLAIYSVQNKKDAEYRHDILASATKEVLNKFSKDNSCFKDTNLVIDNI